MEFLVIDTETTGLPENMDISPTNFDKWPRLVEVAWIICDGKGKVYKNESHIIIPDGFKITNAHIHGITTEKAKEEGRQLKNVLTELRADMMQADISIAHNVDFDMNVIAAEEYRNFNYAISDKLHWFCTQKQTAQVLQIARTAKCPHNGPYKWPNLRELMNYCFALELPTKHRAADDAEQCRMALFELVRRKEINPLEAYKKHHLKK